MLLPLNKIDVAFVTEGKIKNWNISDQKKQFLGEYQFFFKFLVSKILDKCPFYVMFQQGHYSFFILEKCSTLMYVLNGLNNVWVFFSKLDI